MSIENPERFLFKLWRPLLASELPTQGYVPVFRLNERTKTFYIKSVNHKDLSPKQVYDKFEAEIQDAVSMQGFFHNPPTVLYIALFEPLRSGFRQIVDVCRGLPPPGSTASVETADATVREATGVSLLASAVVRELLLYIAVSCNGIASRCTARQTRNIAAIAAAGGPSDEPTTKMFREYLGCSEDTHGGPVKPLAEVALLRGGWRRPSWASLLALSNWPDEENLEDDNDMEAGARELLQLLIELDYLHPSPTDAATAQLLHWIPRRGSVTALRTLIGENGLLPIQSLTADTRATMLIEVAYVPDISLSNPRQFQDRGAMLNYLVDDLGFDPNGQARRWSNAIRPSGIRESPLHVAMRWRNTKLARLLVEKGASMDAKNEEGQTPAELGSL